MEIVNKNGEFYRSNEVRAIQEWLFGRAEPKYLTILDPDKGAESYLCYLTNEQKKTVGDKVFGWSFTVYSIYPYSISNLIEKEYNCPNDITEITFYNLSDMETYLYPQMDVQMLGNASYLRLENYNDNSRVFQLTNLIPRTSFTIDNDLRYMKEINNNNIFQHFNLNWLRLLPGFNKIEVTGSCHLKLSTRWKRAIGGY